MDSLAIGGGAAEAGERLGFSSLSQVKKGLRNSPKFLLLLAGLTVVFKNPDKYLF